MDFVLVTATKSNSRQRAERTSEPQLVARATPPTSNAAVSAPDRPRASTPATQDVFRPQSNNAPRSLAGVDRRWSARAKVEKLGWIAIASREEPVTCTVCNVSKYGAMLEFATADAIGSPRDRQTDTFVLVWLTNRVRSEATCTVRWRSGKLIGVNFAGPVRTMVDRR